MRKTAENQSTIVRVGNHHHRVARMHACMDLLAPPLLYSYSLPHNQLLGTVEMNFQSSAVAIQPPAENEIWTFEVSASWTDDPLRLVCALSSSSAITVAEWIQYIMESCPVEWWTVLLDAKETTALKMWFASGVATSCRMKSEGEQEDADSSSPPPEVTVGLVCCMNDGSKKLLDSHFPMAPFLQSLKGYEGFKLVLRSATCNLFLLSDSPLPATGQPHELTVEQDDEYNHDDKRQRISYQSTRWYTARHNAYHAEALEQERERQRQRQQEQQELEQRQRQQQRERQELVRLIEHEVDQLREHQRRQLLQQYQQQPQQQQQQEQSVAEVTNETSLEREDSSLDTSRGTNANSTAAQSLNTQDEQRDGNMEEYHDGEAEEPDNNDASSIQVEVDMNETVNGTDESSENCPTQRAEGDNAATKSNTSDHNSSSTSSSSSSVSSSDESMAEDDGETGRNEHDGSNEQPNVHIDLNGIVGSEVSGKGKVKKNNDTEPEAPPAVSKLETSKPLAQTRNENEDMNDDTSTKSESSSSSSSSSSTSSSSSSSLSSSGSNDKQANTDKAETARGDMEQKKPASLVKPGESLVASKASSTATSKASSAADDIKMKDVDVPVATSKDESSKVNDKADPSANDKRTSPDSSSDTESDSDSASSSSSSSSDSSSSSSSGSSTSDTSSVTPKQASTTPAVPVTLSQASSTGRRRRAPLLAPGRKIIIETKRFSL